MSDLACNENIHSRLMETLKQNEQKSICVTEVYTDGFIMNLLGYVVEFTRQLDDTVRPVVYIILIEHLCEILLEDSETEEGPNICGADILRELFADITQKHHGYPTGISGRISFLKSYTVSR